MKNVFVLIIAAVMFISCSETTQSENLNFPDKLLGVEMTYTYSKGNSYVVKFEEED